MRILMLSWEYPPHNVGGLGKHVVDLIPALNSLGVNVHLLTPRWFGGLPEEDAIESTGEARVYRVEPPAVDMADFFTNAWRTNINLEQKGRDLVEQLGPFDLIHAHDWLVAFAGVALKHAYKIPLLATIHATEHGRSGGHLASEMQRAINNVEWWLTFEAWRVIVCSFFMRDEVIRALNVPPDKIDVIPNAVDPTLAARLNGIDLAAFRARFALPHEPIVYYVGRIVWEKGVQTLVEAAPQVLAQFPQTKFVVAGTGSAVDQLRWRAGELGVADRFVFTGFISDEDRNTLFKVADVAVFPSLYEPFGIVALEAMAAGTPVVATNVGGFAEVITSHETGILVEPNNPGSLAWGILHTLGRPDWAQARAANALKLVQTTYTWRRVAERTLSVYERVVAERRRTVW